MIRRCCWEAVEGMRTQFGMLADVDLWMRLAARWDVGYVREPLITVRQSRPADYPSAYAHWSWERMRILYEIHGTNRTEHYRAQPARLAAELALFRARVSFDELFWMTYAVAKRRWTMLDSANSVENAYELPPARWARRLVTALVKL